MNKKLLYTLTVVLLILPTYFSLQFLKNKTVPELPPLTDLNSEVFDPTTLNGKPSIVSYFQTWCGDCIKEQPQLVKLQEHFGKDNLNIILISDEPIEKLQKFQSVYNYDLKIFHTTQGLKKDIGIKAFPTTVLYSSDSKIIEKKVEGINWYNQNVIGLIENDLKK